MSVRPVIIEDEWRLIALLRGRREALGIGQQELDDRLGFPEAYVAKAEASERSYGKRVIWGMSRFLFYWLEALGLRLVLMDAETAQRLAADDSLPALTASTHRPYPARRDRCGVARETRVMRTFAFTRPAA